MKTHAVEYLVPRTSLEEFTCAIVRATVSDKHVSSETGFFQRLTDAVTEWVKATQAGQRAWEESSQDLNIGDLSGYCKNKALQPILASHGIMRLDIETHVRLEQRAAHTYDTHLVDESKLLADEDFEMS